MFAYMYTLKNVLETSYKLYSNADAWCMWNVCLGLIWHRCAMFIYVVKLLLCFLYNKQAWYIRSVIHDKGAEKSVTENRDVYNRLYVPAEKNNNFSKVKVLTVLKETMVSWL